MKEKRNLLVCIFLSAIIGWAAGYLRFPFIEMNDSFAIGFIFAAALIMLSFTFIQIWNKNKAIRYPSSLASDLGKPNKNQHLVFSILGIVVFITAVWYLLSLFNHNQVTSKFLIQNQKIKEQAQLIASSRKCDLNVLLNEVFDEVNEELETNNKKTLNDNTIDRIVSMNRTFQAYPILDDDSTSIKKLSPERGQLLLSLASINLDSNSFNAIKNQASFEGADLRNAKLKNIDLSGIDLRNANLREANLSGSNLTNANLSKSDLWGADLQSSKLIACKLQNVNLSWANLSSANLNKANLNGAQLNNSNLKKSNFKKAHLEWAKTRNAHLNDSNFNLAKLTGTDLASSNLTNTNFSEATMNLVNFSDAIMEETNLLKAKLSKATVIEQDWIQTLKTNNVIGYNEIDSLYKTIIEPSGKYNFRLIKK